MEGTTISGRNLLDSGLFTFAAATINSCSVQKQLWIGKVLNNFFSKIDYLKLGAQFVVVKNRTQMIVQYIGASTEFKKWMFSIHDPRQQLRGLQPFQLAYKG